MELVLFALVLIVGLVLIPLGLPGTWLMLAGGLGYNLIARRDVIGWWSLGGCIALALVAEAIEWSLSARYTRKYGGSNRAGWGAIVGGMVGAMIGVPVPIVGPVLGAFAGSFVGALVFEYSRERNAGQATRVATGALIGRVLATTAKSGIGFAIAVWLFIAAM
jgi:uncharacterized protein YqgC (DUF456 family)